MATVGHVDEKGILWKASQPGKFTDSFNSCPTLWHTIEASGKQNASRPAAGQRPVLTTTIVDGFEKVTLGEFEWVTYGKYLEQVEHLAAGLVGAVPTLSPKDTVVLYADTQRAWMMSAYASWRQGLVVGTIYATLGEEGALFGINQSKCKLVFADSKLLKVLSKIASKFKYLKDIVSITEPPAEALAAIEAAGIRVHKMEALIEAGAKKPVAATPSKPEDTAVLMYTSGTTGNPKGVLLSHQAILAVVAATCSPTSAVMLHGRPLLRQDTVYLAYLPLAHIMELAVEVTHFAIGAKVGYGNPGTLAPTSPKMLQTKPPQIGDAQMLEPTVFVAAPAVLDRLLIAIKAKFAATKPFVQRMIAAGIKSGEANFDQGGVGTKHCIAKLIFKKAQKLLGGRVEVMLTGSAPLGVEVQKYVQTVFNCPVRQGYGLTETCAATCIALAEDNSTACVGPPQESACIRLRDWEEGNYLNSDLTSAVGMRRGEILIGGPTVAQGYLVDASDPDPEIVAKNQDDFVTIDGIRYFCTGDIGQFTPRGNLQIIDRKKDLVKLQMGEYVALSKVENAIKSSKFTALPMVHATSSMSYCIALICPNIPTLKKTAAELGVDGELAAMCVEPKLLDAVLKDVQAVCKASGLQRFEIPTKVVLIEELWTPDNDMLTAVQKLKRRQILEKHKAQVDAVYV
ncbi:hypothetical protein AB1Y20_002949 [Prymnesium parvum]|uniref:AMP-dependent synthetase/ligase domain-containing protein n=1 Tax=Prymnesium parvum TaxID=97485 RepID=A0AB34JAL9_PRYPA